MLMYYMCIFIHRRTLSCHIHTNRKIRKMQLYRHTNTCYSAMISELSYVVRHKSLSVVVLQVPKMSSLSMHKLPSGKRRGVEQASPTSGAYALGGQKATCPYRFEMQVTTSPRNGQHAKQISGSRQKASEFPCNAIQSNVDKYIYICVYMYIYIYIIVCIADRTVHLFSSCQTLSASHRIRIHTSNHSL